MSRLFDALRRLEESGELSAHFDHGARALLAQPVAVGQQDEQQDEIGEILSVQDDPTEQLQNGDAETRQTACASAARVLPCRIAGDSPLFAFIDDTKAGDQYRMIRTKLAHHPLSPKVMMVSSADPGDGKTVSSINLAAAMALKPDLRILLVDCDLHRGKISESLGLPQQPGLSECLEGACSLMDAITQLEQFPNLFVLTAGCPSVPSADLLDSEEWLGAVKQFRAMFDYTIIDTPPLGVVGDTDLIGQACDGIVFVARPDFTNRTRLLKALKSAGKDRLLGLLLNAVDSSLIKGKHAYYSYYSPKDSPREKPLRK